MQLYNPDTTPLIDVEVSDESYAYKQIMSRDDLTLYFSLTSYIEMPIDMYCVFQNMMYYLTDESNFTQHGSRNFEYTLKLDAPIAYMKKTKFKFVTLDKEPDGSIKLNAPAKTKFSLRGTPSDFLDMLVDCMNYNDKSGGWTKGECIEGEDLLMDINDLFCYEFLGQLADQYKTEFDVVGKTIHLKKVENKNLPPIPLAYGKGNGLLYGLERKIYKTPVSRVWIESSDRNIDAPTYGADTLRLEKNKTFVYEGIEYITDATGSYVERKIPLRDTTVPPEATLDVTEIYPSHEGTITSVEAIDDSKGLYAFIDIDNVIDYNKVTIAGETATIIFQTGELAGSEKEYEFAYDHTRKRFRIKPITDNGLVYPQGTIIPAVGDKYAVFHIKLPQEYIDEAQEKALNEVVAFLYENEQPQYTYSAPIDQKYAKEDWGIIGDRLKVGYFIRLSDEQYLPEGADIRITAVTTFVNKPRMPKIELSNSVTRTSFNTEINKIDNQEQTIERKNSNTLRTIKGLNYLKTALENSTTIEGGVILTTLIRMGFMVDDEWQENSGINGINQNPDDVAFWAGGTLDQAVNLVANPNATDDVAQIVITHSGGIIANNAYIKGKINATSGLIGGIKISGESLTNEGFNNNAYIILRNDLSKTFAGIGGNMLPASAGGISAVARFENNKVDTDLLAPDNIALLVSASGSRNKNTAIMMNGGCLSGLALMPLQVNSNETLTNSDVWVSCYNTSNVTITLPTKPEKGKVFYLRQINSSGFTIVGKSSTQSYQIQTSTGSIVDSMNFSSHGGTAMLLFDGQFWCYSYMGA